MKRCILSLLVLQFFSFILCEDPFSALGIPILNRESILDNDPSFPTKFTIKPFKRQSVQYAPDLKSIEDLPSFLEKANLNEEDGIKMLTKFLIADDYFLKKYGAVYDQTGFDGISENEPIAPFGSPMRLVQRAKSAASLWYRNNYQSGYEAYGAEIVNNQGNMNWKVFKVLLVGKDCGADHTFVNVCIPLQEDLVPLVVNENEECMSKIIFVENAKIKNIPYLKKIGQSHFFHRPGSINKQTKPAIHQMQNPINPNRNMIAFNPFGNSNYPYNLKSQNINPNYNLSNLNNNFIQRGIKQIIPAPPIIKPNLNINNPMFNYLNKALLSNNRINIIPNKTNTTTFVKTTFNKTSNTTSQFDEIKFFQHSEKLIPKENKTDNTTNLITDKLIENIFETSKKKLLILVKQGKVNNISLEKEVKQDLNTQNRIDQIEKGLKNLNLSVNKLEKRLDNDEKNSSKTAEELSQIKHLLEGNFQKLDVILSSLTKKNIK